MASLDATSPVLLDVPIYLRNLLVVIVLQLVCIADASAHGGVALDEADLCLITVGFLKAHFTIYQPEESGAKGFCEDVPVVGNSVFVMNYLHAFMREMPVDFRIVDDVNNVGLFASWDDIESMDDIDSHTLFYDPPAIHSEGVYTVNYRFTQPGVYIGVVTARNPNEDKVYHAVFPFRVGGKNYGYLPLFALLLVAAQLAYWYINRRLKRAQTDV